MEKYSEEKVVEAFYSATSLTDFAKKLGMRMNNGSIANAKVIAARFGLDCEEIKKPLVSHNVNQFTCISDEEYFVNPSSRRGQASKKRLIRMKKVIDECSECGIGPEWNGKKLVLQLDHIDGNSFNNLIENLRILCPNCHSQTDTYANKNVFRHNYCNCGERIDERSKSCRKCYDLLPLVERDNRNYKKRTNGSKQKLTFPPLDDLLETITEIGWSGASRQYGILDNTLRKFVQRNGINPKTVKKLTKKEKENRSKGVFQH